MIENNIPRRLFLDETIERMARAIAAAALGVTPEHRIINMLWQSHVPAARAAYEELLKIDAGRASAFFCPDHKGTINTAPSGVKTAL